MKIGVTISGGRRQKSRLMKEKKFINKYVINYLTYI